MAVVSEIKELKLNLKLAEGQITVGNCNPDATDEQIFQLAEAVASLASQSCDAVYKSYTYLMIKDYQKKDIELEEGEQADGS